MYSNYRGGELPRITKQVVEEYIAYSLQVPANRIKFVRIKEAPSVWRHACVPTGVVVQKPARLVYGGVPIDFAVCRSCGKVSYYFEAV